MKSGAKPSGRTLREPTTGRRTGNPGGRFPFQASRPLVALGPGSGFDGGPAIAADTSARGVNEWHQHVSAALVLAGARIAKRAFAFLHAFGAELGSRLTALRARNS